MNIIESKVTANDISIAHRLGTKKTARPIIVKFSRRIAKVSMLTNKKKLKDNPLANNVRIIEDISRARVKFLNLMRTELLPHGPKREQYSSRSPTVNKSTSSTTSMMEESYSIIAWMMFCTVFGTTNINNPKIVTAAVPNVPLKTKVSVMQLNVRSLKPHYAKLEALILSLESPPDVICLTGTWLTANDDPKCCLLPGYRQFVFRNRKSTGGGVMMQLNENCVLRKIVHLKRAFYQTFQFMGLYILLSDSIQQTTFK